MTSSIFDANMNYLVSDRVEEQEQRKRPASDLTTLSAVEIGMAAEDEFERDRRLDVIEKELKELQIEWEKVKAHQYSDLQIRSNEFEGIIPTNGSGIDKFKHLSVNSADPAIANPSLPSPEPITKAGELFDMAKNVRQSIKKRNEQYPGLRKKRINQTTAELIQSSNFEGWLGPIPPLPFACSLTFGPKVPPVTNQTAPILSLPDELFLHIFSYLEPQELRYKKKPFREFLHLTPLFYTAKWHL